jgi:hypothetical protein
VAEGGGRHSAWVANRPRASEIQRFCLPLDIRWTRSGCGGEVVLEGGRRRGQQCGLTSGGEHRERWTVAGSGGAAHRAGSETGELCG